VFLADLPDGTIANPFGAGNTYDVDSPTNSYGSGWRIEGQ